MTYGIEWEQDARNGLRKIGSPVAQRILLKIDWLRTNFEVIRLKPLTGPLQGYFKLVVGDYRVLYSVSRSRKVILIRAVGHRSNVYKLDQ